jgi:hypothetical protein
MKTQELEVWLTKADVGRLLGLTPSAIRAAAIAGRLTVAATTATGVRLFRREDVEAYVASRRAPRRTAA